MLYLLGVVPSLSEVRMSSDSGSTPSGTRRKTTEISDLPDSGVDDAQAGDVKGGGLIVPCVRTIQPCIKPAIPCIRNIPSSPIRTG